MVVRSITGSRARLVTGAIGLLVLTGVMAWRRMKRRRAATGASVSSSNWPVEHPSHPHIRPDNSDPDDETLKDRIQSELFRDPRIPKDRINISVAFRTVDVRGEVDSEDDKRYIEEQIGLIQGVGSVRSYLHLPGTDAPNKEEAIEASDETQG